MVASREQIASSTASRGPRKKRSGPRPKVVDLRTRALIKRAVDGDEAAFTALYRDHVGFVTGVLHKLMGSDPNVEDAVQITFVEVHRCLHRYEGRSKFSTWVAGVALNVGRRMRRRRNYAISDEHAASVTPSSTPSPHELAEGREMAQHAAAILVELTDVRRNVLVQADFGGASHQRLSQTAGVPVATVRTRLFYARRDFWAKAAADPVLAAVAG